MKILFTRRVKVQQHDGQGAVYEDGTVHDLPVASVGHWLARDAGTTDADKIAEAEAALAKPKPAPKRSAAGTFEKAVPSPPPTEPPPPAVEEPAAEEPKPVLQPDPPGHHW